MKNRHTINLTTPIFLWVLLFGVLITAPHAIAQSNDTRERLNALNQQISQSQQRRESLSEQAKEEAAFIANLSKELVLRAERLSIQEQNLTEITDQIGKLNTDISSARSDLNNRRQRLMELLAALQRLSQHPPELVFIRPSESIDTVQSAALLAEILPKIQDEASQLKIEMDNLNALIQNLNVNQQHEQDVLNGLRNDRDEMASLLAQRQQNHQNLLSEEQSTERRIQQLAAEAKSLEGLLASLANEGLSSSENTTSPIAVPESYPTNIAITKARGQLVFPVVGDIEKGYGAPTETGNTKGISILPQPKSTVISPYDGRIIYSGPFRKYGPLLIIAHGEGYHSLLAGMEQRYGSVGQWVLTGEPVGTMAPPNNSENANQPNGSKTIYLELRKNGSPINPNPWFAPMRKVSG